MSSQWFIVLIHLILKNLILVIVVLGISSQVELLKCEMIQV